MPISGLHTNLLWLRHQDALVIVESELRVNNIAFDELDLVGFELSFLHFEEIPGDHILVCGGHDARLLATAVVVVVETSWGEINASNVVFG